jgi:hypothetical protein
LFFIRDTPLGEFGFKKHGFSRAFLKPQFTSRIAPKGNQEERRLYLRSRFFCEQKHPDIALSISRLFVVE